MQLRPDNIEALRQSDIPEYMHQSILDYYEHGYEPGSFLSAIINNDLSGAIGHADNTNAQHLKDYVLWFYWHAPSGTWGYPDAVNDYITKLREAAECVDTL